MGGTTLLLYGLLSGGLRGGAFRAVLRDTMAVSGALFALFVAATTFTLVFRAFGTDRLLDSWVSLVPGGATGAAIAVLVVFALSAFVLDAFEIVFVIVPIVMPSMLTRAPDAVWISVAGAAGAAGELPGAADRLCRDDGAQRARPEGADRAARARARTLSSPPSLSCWCWWCCCRGSPISPSPWPAPHRPSKRSTTKPPASASTTC